MFHLNLITENTSLLYLFIAFLVFTLFFLIIIIIGKKINSSRKIKNSLNFVTLKVEQTRHGGFDENNIDSLKKFDELIHSIVPEKKAITFELSKAANDSSVLFLISTPDGVFKYS